MQPGEQHGRPTPPHHHRPLQGKGANPAAMERDRLHWGVGCRGDAQAPTVQCVALREGREVGVGGGRSRMGGGGEEGAAERGYLLLECFALRGRLWHDKYGNKALQSHQNTHF